MDMESPLSQQQFEFIQSPPSAVGVARAVGGNVGGGSGSTSAGINHQPALSSTSSISSNSSSGGQTQSINMSDKRKSDLMYILHSFLKHIISTIIVSLISLTIVFVCDIGLTFTFMII
jgi:hypothetical protein